MQVLIYSHCIIKVTTTPAYSLSRQRIRFHASVIIFTPAYSLSHQRIHASVFTFTPAYSLPRQRIHFHANVFTFTPTYSRQRIYCHASVFTFTPAYLLTRQRIYLHASVFTYTPVLLILLPAILIIFIGGTNKSNLVINSLCGETVRCNRLNNCIVDFLRAGHSKSSVD